MTLAYPVSAARRRPALVAAESPLYPHDIAAKLGVTEAGLVALKEGALAA